MQKVSIAWRPDYAARMHGMQASEIRELLKIAERADVVSFAGGIPDPALFPIDRVREACDRHPRRSGLRRPGAAVFRQRG